MTNVELRNILENNHVSVASISSFDSVSLRLGSGEVSNVIFPRLNGIGGTSIRSLQSILRILTNVGLNVRISQDGRTVEVLN